MRGKKALLRIIEVVFAILIIAGASVYLYAQQSKNTSVEDQIYSIEDGILREVSSNSRFRDSVLAEDSAGIAQINAFIEPRIPKSLNFTTKVCPPDDVCGMPVYIEGKEVYAKETFISATLTAYSPKKFKIFMWVK
ncbi:hypothetical protein HYT92_02315 [Candidatus Pacearchaeota archaeon]|nr:hypothetical protein [Candidatus Pacearchaeota archaeon]